MVEAFINFMHDALVAGASIGRIFLEGVGVVILFYAGIKNLIGYIKRESNISHNISKSISLALSFMLAGEVLGTVTTSEWSKLLQLAVIVVLRVSIDFIIQWELKHSDMS